MIEVGDIVRFVNPESHEYGRLLRPLLEKERGKLFIVVKDDTAHYAGVIRVGSSGKAFILERYSHRESPFHPGNRVDSIWEGWLVKDEFMSAVVRAQRLGPDAVEEQETEA